MDILLFGLLRDENEIDAMLTHDINAALQPRDGLLVVDEVLHLVKDENAVVAYLLVIKIADYVSDVLNFVILDESLVNVRQGRQRRDRNARDIGEKRAASHHSGEDDVLHGKKSLSRSGIPVMYKKLTWHTPPLVLTWYRLNKGEVLTESPTDKKNAENKNSILYRAH